MTEDSRLLIVAYCLIQSERPESVFLAVKTVQQFTDFTIFEEAAPISTMETAFALILLEYNEIVRRSGTEGSVPAALFYGDLPEINAGRESSGRFSHLRESNRFYGYIAQEVALTDRKTQDL